MLSNLTQQKENTMAFNPVGWFELYVDDMERAKAFYETVFQVSLTQLPKFMEHGPEMYAWPMVDQATGAGGALCKMPNVKPGTGGTLVYFSCIDCQVEADRVEAAGGTLISKKFKIGEHGFVAVAKDTEGNTIGLHSRQ